MYFRKLREILLSGSGDWISSFQTKFVKDSLWLLVSYSILAVIGILINVFITTKFGAGGFGQFSLALKIYLIVSLLSSLGSGVSIVKFTSHYKVKGDDFRHCLSAGLMIGVTAGLIFMIFSMLLAGMISEFFNMPELRRLILSMCPAIPLFCVNKVFSGSLNGLREHKFLSIVLSLRWITLFAAILFFSIKAEISTLGWSFLISESLLFAILTIYHRRYLTFNIQQLIPWIKKHLSFGMKSISSNITLDIYFHLDVFVIGYYLGAVPVGVYSFASDLAKNLFMPANILETAFNPIASGYSARKEFDNLRTTAIKLRNHTYLLYVPFVAVAMIIYPIVVYSMSDPSILESIPIFMILSLGVLSISGFKPIFAITEMSGYPNDRLYINLTTLAFSLALGLTMFMLWGIIGMALAIVLSYFVWVLALNVSARKRLSLDLLKW